jgi:hypothetical protein
MPATRLFCIRFMSELSQHRESESTQKPLGCPVQVSLDRTAATAQSAGRFGHTEAFKQAQDQYLPLALGQFAHRFQNPLQVADCLWAAGCRCAGAGHRFDHSALFAPIILHGVEGHPIKPGSERRAPQGRARRDLAVPSYWPDSGLAPESARLLAVSSKTRRFIRRSRNAETMRRRALWCRVGRASRQRPAGHCQRSVNPRCPELVGKFSIGGPE